MERHPRTSSRAMAKSLPAVANRNLLRRKNATDRTVGVLGIYLARTQEFMALPKVDSGNGALRPSQAQKLVGLLAVDSGCSAFQHDIHFASLARSDDLRGSCAIGSNLQIAHTSEYAEDLVGRALGIIRVNLGNLALAHKNLEPRRIGLK